MGHPQDNALPRPIYTTDKKKRLVRITGAWRNDVNYRAVRLDKERKKEPTIFFIRSIRSTNLSDHSNSLRYIFLRVYVFFTHSIRSVLVDNSRLVYKSSYIKYYYLVMWWLNFAAVRAFCPPASPMAINHAEFQILVDY